MARSPTGRAPSRSRSPPRRPKGTGGFRWKDERRPDSGRHRERRDRSPRRHRDRSRERGRDRDGERDRDRDQDRNRNRDRDRKRDGKEHKKKEHKDDREPPKRAAPAASQPAEEMMIINVNDRLGTKTAIPCLGSDTIKQLKLMVAARIGREAGQIMLRRQGERPFKDQLTIDDYGISSGVQLDLEVDTGD